MERKRLSLSLTMDAYRMLTDLAKGDGLTITGWLEMIIRRLWNEKDGGKK